MKCQCVNMDCAKQYDIGKMDHASFPDAFSCNLEAVCKISLPNAGVIAVCERCYHFYNANYRIISDLGIKVKGE